MSREAESQGRRIDRFFAGPGARADQWCHLMELIDAWSSGSGERAEFDVAFDEMIPTEGFHAYPGLELMTALREHSAANDVRGVATLTRRITRAILTRSFRQNGSDWHVHDDGEAVVPGSLHPALTRTERSPIGETSNPQTTPAPCRYRLCRRFFPRTYAARSSRSLSVSSWPAKNSGRANAPSSATPTAADRVPPQPPQPPHPPPHPHPVVLMPIGLPPGRRHCAAR